MTYRCFVCNKTVSGSLLVAKHPAGGGIPACSECCTGMLDGDAYLERTLNSLAADRPRSGKITRIQVVRAIWGAALLPAEDDLEKAFRSSSSENILWQTVLRAVGSTPDERVAALCHAGLDPFLACHIALGGDPMDIHPLQRYSQGFRNKTQVVLEHTFGLSKNLAAAVIFGSVKLDEAIVRVRLDGFRHAEDQKLSIEKERQRKDRLVAYMENFLVGNVPDPDLVARKVLDSLRKKAAQKVFKWGTDTCSQNAEKKSAICMLANLDAVAIADIQPAEKMEAFRLSVTEFTGWKKLERWFVLLRDTGASLITRREWEKQESDKKRKSAAEKRGLQSQKEHEIRLVQEKDLVKALYFRFSEMGVSEPLTPERIRWLQKMLPEDNVKALKFECLYDLFGISQQEPAWLHDAPDPAVLEGFCRSVSDDVLLDAWNDRWITAGTVAKEFVISINRAREIMDKIGFIETRNPHYRSAEPMRLVRISLVNAWVSANRENIAQWTIASNRARQTYQRQLDEKASELRSLPERITSIANDPTPLVCFWLTLLNRAAKSGHPEMYKIKDDTLRSLVHLIPPTNLEYVSGGDREEKVWLCDRCIEAARENNMHPLEYIDAVGPCKNCQIKPAESRYYDLYEIRYIFDGIGKFSYHVPYDIGRGYLPNPEQFSEEAVSCRGMEGGWAFGRPLNKIEQIAFSVDEIKENLLTALNSLNTWAKEAIASTA